MSHIIYSGTPTLPYTFEYVPQGDGEVLVSLSGTAWTSNSQAKIGLEMVVAGVVVNSAWIWSNAPTEHRTLHTGLSEYKFPLNIDASTHKINPVSITIRAMAATNFDVNDIVTIAHV